MTKSPPTSNGQNLSPSPPPIQSTIKDFQPSKDNFSLHDRAIFLLSDGIRLDRVAEILNMKYDTVQKAGKRASKVGILTQDPIAFPALYVRGPLFDAWKRTASGQAPSPTQKNPDIAEPHRFQVQYFIGSRGYRDALDLPTLRRRYHLAKFDERIQLSAIWETKILTISVKQFCPGTAKQKVENGLKTAREYTDAHNAAGARLRFRRLLGRIEWVIQDKQLGDFMIRLLGLKPGDYITINQARFVVDSSHGGRLEINAKFPYPEGKPTENVETLEFLLDRRKLLATVELMKAQLELQADHNVLLQQKVNILEAELKKRG